MLDPVARPGRPGPRAEAAGRRGREGSLRGGPDGHDAAGVPVLRRGAGTAAPGRRPLRQELRRHHAAGATAGHGRPVRRRNPRPAVRRLDPAARHLPGGLRRGPSTTGSSSRPTAAACSTPTASRSSKAASRHELEGHRGHAAAGRATARCCTCSKPCRCFRSGCRAAALPRLAG